MGYDAKQVEERWQERWRRERVFEARPDPLREKFYLLEMLPYPSGIIHVGHVRNYAIGDALAWRHRMRGCNVFHPIGWDALGLPAENAAIQRGAPPAEWTYSNIAHMKGQIQRLGFSYDWTTEIATCHPGYYKWNQWFFLRMLERDLAYRARRSLNWCPRCGTVLAEAQVTPSNCCWRHEDTPVEKVELEQWFLRITLYADRLLAGLDRLEGSWPEGVVAAQRHWIGRSEGCRFSFKVADLDASIDVFTTRVDTVFGCSALFLAAGHPLARRLVTGTRDEAAVASWIAAETTGAQPPPEEKEKRGVFTGRWAINPFTGERTPIWLANFVLMEFGTGAVFAQPAHDQRDYEFARKYGLAIRPVIRPEGGELADPATMTEAMVAPGVLDGSGPFSGLTTAEAKVRMAEHAKEHGFGGPEVQYRLKDWGISRQRYWGTPIPVIYCQACGVTPVPDEDLPVVLPEVRDWKGRTGSPLAQIESWVNVRCPRCGGPARRETDTMDTFVDSSWYFLRYLDPRNDAEPFAAAKADYWMPVDLYIGGVEHSTGHLIYFRFWTMFLRDLGLLKVDEPAPRLFTQGMVRARSYRCPVHDYLRPDEVDAASENPVCPRCGRAVEVHIDKMSKSKLNVVDPDELIDRYGRDAMRLFSLFGGPPVQDLEWTEQGIQGTWRFVQRVARLFEKLAPAARQTAPAPDADAPDASALALRRMTHRTIERVTRDIDKDFQFNTAIAALMELVNELHRCTDGAAPAPGSPQAAAVAEALDVFVLLLAPFAPHLAEEMNSWLGRKELVARRRWPKADPALLAVDEVVLPVQLQGRLRGQIKVAAGAGEDEVLAAIRADADLSRRLEGKTVVRVVLVPDRLVNLVVRG